MLRSSRTMLSKNISVSRLHGISQILVEIREKKRVRLDVLQVLQVQPLVGENR